MLAYRRYRGASCVICLSFIHIYCLSYNIMPTNLKILVVLLDGNSETSSGDLMDTFRLREGAKQLMSTTNRVKIVGALIPNIQGTQRIHELQSIFSEPNYTINKDFANTSSIELAQQLAMRVKRWVCPGGRF